MDIQIHQSFARTSIVIKALMDAESLRKILCEIEARLSAPVDTKDPEALTPYHIWTGTKFFDLPKVDQKNEDWLPKSPTAFQLRKCWCCYRQLIAQ
ncbi:hypothetical protein T4D_5908 [Trichinella pseudospiralis]|uniref:Uncharacterized protein n=1 Tax=Trichinella pseudospiralis TaxID=6337 RepID=A0A0V1FV68_TRIPS|nr:hypothetical protein T4D_5908 [Trichinella pseudospiralis]